MKRGFLSKRNALLSPKGLSAGVAALLFVFFFGLIRLVAPNFFLVVWSPAFGAGDVTASALHGFLASFGDTATLANENARLTEQNTALTLENRTLAEKQNTFTKLLGEDPAHESGILAGVLARPPQTAYDSLIVSAGRQKGIASGMEVFAEGGVPVGVIVSTDASHARAKLFSSYGVSTEGWVSKEHTPLTLLGAGGGAFTATLPRSVSVAVGDVVYVPGPGALPVGTVARIDSDPVSPIQTLRIAPAVNLFSLTWVLIRDSGAAFNAIVASSTPS